ncbi:MAG TPA: EamA family transporter, partial [Burkholderiales bacterium]
MTPADIARLVALAAIWGAAFIFMRVAAPVLGPVWTPELRVLLGGLALLAWFRLAGFDPGLRAHWRSYLVVGAIGIAAPFALYSFAAIHAPASLLAIVNATAPIFGLAWNASFRDERVTVRKAAGLAL